MANLCNAECVGIFTLAMWMAVEAFVAFFSSPGSIGVVRESGVSV
jgi:hypothetical protein